MEHQISYASVTHLVKIPASEILELAGTDIMPDSPYVTWVPGDGYSFIQISWVEEIDPNDYMPVSLAE